MLKRSKWFGLTSLFVGLCLVLSAFAPLQGNWNGDSIDPPPVTEPTDDPVLVETTEDPVGDPVDPTVEPTEDPALGDPTEEPTGDPVDPTVEPTDDPALGDPTAEPTEDPESLLLLEETEMLGLDLALRCPPPPVMIEVCKHKNGNNYETIQIEQSKLEAFLQSDNKNYVGACHPDKVTICHAAGRDGTLHYVTLEISWNAVYGPGGHFNENGTPQAGHEDDYLGACVVVPVINTASLSVNNDCSGGSVAVTASAGASYSAPSWNYSMPYDIEGVPAGSVTVSWATGTPLSMTLDYLAVQEPSNCLVTLDHSYTTDSSNDCDGYAWSASVEKGSYTSSGSMSGSWSDIYTQETASPPTITVTWDDGVSIQKELSQIVEPSSCLVILGHEYEITRKSTCEGYSWEVDVTDGTYSTKDLLEGVWTQKYTLESSPNPSILIKFDDGVEATVLLDTINEPEECLSDRPDDPEIVIVKTQNTGAGSLPIQLPAGLAMMVLGAVFFFKKDSLEDLS